MRICVYGAGAMGTSLGALLSLVCECDLVSRNRAHVSALKANGATLEKNGAVYLQTSVKAFLPEEMKGEYDCIVLAVKQRENSRVAEFLMPYCKADGCLLTVQNGLPEEALAKVFGKERVYGAALSWGAELAESGIIKITSDAGFRVGLGACGKGARLQELAELLREAGCTVAEDKLIEIRFAKLATNASFSTLSVISGLPFGVLAKKYKRHCVRLIRETFAVARACGCAKLPLNGHDLFKSLLFCNGLLLPAAMKKYRNTRSGMLKDLESGRRCDVDFTAGAVIRKGKQCGVPVPYLERAVALVHDVENGLAESAPETLEFMDETGV